MSIPTVYQCEHASLSHAMSAAHHTYHYHSPLSSVITSTHTSYSKLVIITHWIERGLTSQQTHYRSYWGRAFTAQMT